MFVVVDIEHSGFIPVPNVNQYKSVCLIRTKSCTSGEDGISATTPTYVLGDFVKLSQVKGRWVGLIGLTECEAPCYVNLDARKNTLGLRVLDAEMMPVTCTKKTIALHFK